METCITNNIIQEDLGAMNLVNIVESGPILRRHGVRWHVIALWSTWPRITRGIVDILKVSHVISQKRYHLFGIRSCLIVFRKVSAGSFKSILTLSLPSSSLFFSTQ